MSESWYATNENPNNNCYFANSGQKSSSTVANDEFVPYQSNLLDVSKNDIAIASLNSSVAFQNCLYNPQGDYMELQAHPGDGLRSGECFQESDTFDSYTYSDYNNNKFNENLFRWPQNQPVFPPYNSRIWPRMNRRLPTTQVKESPIKVVLENRSLMEKFHAHCTEMIITKTGRRMFPSPQITLDGLESNTKYFVLFDIVPADDNRYKFHHFNWVIAGKAEPHPPSRMYIHPDSPLTGSQWIKQQIVFHKVKLTNNNCDQHGHMILNSMHRYQPRVHVVAAGEIYSIQFQPFHTFAFPECQFIAVTAYQNSQITHLKIEHNPFAKGFRKPEKEKREKRKNSSSLKEEELTKRMKAEDATENETISKEATNVRDLSSASNSTTRKRGNGYYGLHHNKWNNGPSPSQSHPKMHHYHLSDRPENSMPNYEPHAPRTNQFSNFNATEKLFPYCETPEYTFGNEFVSLEHSGRQFPFPPDFMTGHYKANMPSFI